MKKALAWLLVIAMTAALAVGGTLAYLTDTDEDVNVMTVGQVKIEQLEYERVDVEKKDADATVQEFHDNKPLYPAFTDKDFSYENGEYVTGDSYVDWNQIDKDGYKSEIWDPAKINNEVDKMVFVKNKGDWDAYVRTVFAFEAGKYETLDEFRKMVHLNLNDTDWTWDWQPTPITIGESKYFVATATYNKVLTPGALTEISLSQIALDKTATNVDSEAFGDTYQVLVNSQAVQVAGFTDPDTALNESFGTITSDDIPWENDSPIRGSDLKTSLHYLNADSAGTQITDYVTKIVFGKKAEYPEIVNNNKGTLVDVEQDSEVHVYYVDNSQLTKAAPTYTVYVLSNGVIYAPKVSNTLFNKMGALESVNVEKLNTSRTESMQGMFQKCVKLKKLDVSTWDTSKVTNMAGVFINCNAVEEIVGLENWNTASATTMWRMFDYCYKLKSVNGTGWNLEAVETTEWMFRNCYVLDQVIGSKEWYMPKNTTMKGMFQSCAALESVDVHNWEIPNVTSTWDLFVNCTSLVTVPGIGNWDFGSVEYAISMFYGCNKLQYLDNLSGWDMRKAYDIGFMFESCYVLSEINGIGEWKFENLEKMGWMFEGCYALTELDIGDWNVSKVQTFNHMFASHNQNAGDMKLEKLDLSKWDTSSATTMGAMFYGCGHLTELDLSGWNMPNLTTVSHMFADCHKLEVIDVSGWKTPALTCLDGMFNHCKSLKTIDMSTFDTSNVREFSQLFEHCYSLESIKGLENFNTNNGQDFSEMFSNCYALKELNLSAFNTTNANAKYLNQGQYENWMFLRFMDSCTGLEKVTFGPDFSFDGDGTAPSGYKFYMPAATAVEGWDGHWYDADGNAYLPSEIPEQTARTYYAVNPKAAP